MLFAYGTLMYPLVISGVIGRVPGNRPGAVRGYQRLGVAGQSYPGLIAAGDGVVDGLVYEGLSEEDWRLLTEYESDFYVLENVTLTDGTVARAYLVPEKNRRLLSEEAWQPRAELMPD